MSTNTGNRIIIVTDTAVQAQHHEIARGLLGQDSSTPVMVFPSSSLSLTEARYNNATQDATSGRIVSVPAYTFSLQLKLGQKNIDGTEKSARGHVTLDGDCVPETLRDYAHYLEGVSKDSRIVDPRSVFVSVTDEQGNNRLKCENPSRSWFSMKPQAEAQGVYLFLLGPEVATDIEGRVQNPIHQLTVATMGEFEKTVSSRKTIAATVLQGNEWGSTPAIQPAAPVKASPVKVAPAVQAQPQTPAINANSLLNASNDFF